MKDIWITIEREYGSGGTAIAKKLSKETGIPCYGREILEKVSEEQEVDIERIQAYEETAAGSLSYVFFGMPINSGNGMDMLTQEDRIFIAEQDVIRRLAAKGPAIFLGHCASEALRNRNGVIKVFIRCTDLDAKKERITEQYGIEENKVEQTARRYDKKRANYYRVNNGRRWNDMDNYDIMLDTALLGIDGCVKILKGLLGAEEKED